MNRSNFTVRLPLFLERSGNMCIVIICYSVCGVINFETFLSFLIKLLSCVAKNSEQRFKYLKSQKSFLGETKIFFISFNLLIARNCLRPESGPLKHLTALAMNC